MKGNSLSISNKLILGFCAMLIPVAAIAYFSLTGINKIVENGNSANISTKMAREIAGKEVDLLNWMQQVNFLLINSGTTTLEAEPNDHQCSFGLWLYGTKRKEAVKLAPSLAPLFVKIEQSHAQMHASARDIANIFQSDTNQPDDLLQIKANYLTSMQKIKDALPDGSWSNQKDIPADPTQCKIGRWMYSDKTMELRQTKPDFDILFNELEYPHNKLHGSITDTQKFLDSGDTIGAMDYFTRNTEPLARQVDIGIDKIINWNKATGTPYEAASTIYANTTLPALKHIQAELAGMRKQVQTSLPANQKMLTTAVDIRQKIIIIGVAALILALFIAIIMSRAITGPIKHLADRLRRVTEERNLTLEVPVKGSDNIGAISSALNELLRFLDETFQQVNKVASSVTSSTGDVSERSSQNRERAEKEYDHLQKSIEIITQMKNTDDDLSQSSMAQKEAAMKTNMTMRNLLASMEEISTSAAAQNDEAATAADRVREMSATGDKVAGTAAAQSEMVMNVSISVNNMASAVDDMSNAVEQASNQSRAALEAVQEGSKSVEATIDGMQSIAQSSGQISEIIDVITEIAEQTNLLALNAAIEAARAGSHGKGFAVVADEVGKLAQRSSEAAKEITLLIKDSTARIIEGTRLSDESRKALAEINDGGRINMQAIDDIANTSEVLTTGTNEVQELTERFKSMAEQIGAMAHEQTPGRESAENALASLIEKSTAISNLVIQATEDAKAINDEMSIIDEQMDNMTSMTQEQAGRSLSLMDIAEETSSSAQQTATGAGEVEEITESLNNLSNELTQQVLQFTLRPQEFEFVPPETNESTEEPVETEEKTEPAITTDPEIESALTEEAEPVWETDREEENDPWMEPESSAEPETAKKTEPELEAETSDKPAVEEETDPAKLARKRLKKAIAKYSTRR